MDLTNAELNLVKGSDFKLEELSRLGNRVGTDYLVVGKINSADEWTETKVMRSTGKKFKSINSKISLSVRMINVATSQIVYTDEINFGGKYTMKANLGYVSEVVATKMINSIFPGSLGEPSKPKVEKSSIEDVQKFGQKAINQLKEDSKDDW